MEERFFKKEGGSKFYNHRNPTFRLTGTIRHTLGDTDRMFVSQVKGTSRDMYFSLYTL